MNFYLTHLISKSSKMVRDGLITSLVLLDKSTGQVTSLSQGN